jgi:hypothetical protein
MRTLRRNPYGYAPRKGSKGTMQGFSKLTSETRQHMKMWYELGFTRTEIATVYGVSYGCVAQIVRGTKRK